MTEVEGHFGDSISFDFVGMQLLFVIEYNFLYLLMDSIQVMIAFGQPLILAIIFKFKNSGRNNSMHNLGRHLLHLLQIALNSNKDEHGQKE